ncbi:MAG: response regulator [Pseudomonadota bacterium]
MASELDALRDFWRTAPDDDLSAFLQCAPLLFHSIDNEYRLTRISRDWAQLLGYEAEEMIGRSKLDFLTAEDAAHARSVTLPEFFRTGHLRNQPYNFVSKSGEVIPVLITSSMRFDRTGSFVESLAIVFDNRGAIQARRDLNALAQEAREASRAKSRFLAAMSHEIRTPMNAIMGFAQLLKLSNLDEKRKNHVDAILSAGGSLMNMLTDLLDLSLVEEGRMRIEPREFELFDMLDQIADWWHSSAKQKGLSLTVTLDRSLPRLVRADSTRLQQVLNNFLANAVKFTSEGMVTLGVRLISRDGDLARVRFEVSDTGPGIDPEQTKQLFKPFVQIESDFGKERGGWGLGLSICANIAQNLNADIGVDSTIGAGSTFYFECDLDVLEARTSDAVPPPALVAAEDDGAPHYKVLLAEDNELNRDFMKSILDDLGHSVDVATNGFEAVEAAMQTPYDLIVMDIMMPGLDGIAAAQQIRSLNPPIRDVPIIACSAHVAPEARERYLKTGMNAFVPKPIERTELRRTIQSVVPADTTN